MIFSAEWQDLGVSASPELRATFCLLGIDVDGCRVSRFFDNRLNRAHERIAMPAYPPAQGLAGCWWSLLAGRSGTIRLRRFRDGFVLPDVRFAPDGRYIDVSVEPCEYDNPPVTFPRHAKERISVDGFERDMSDFIEAVLERLSEMGVRNSWLQERWTHIQESLEDGEERLFCEAAGALGIDPYLCNEAEAAIIERAADYFAPDALSEFLAGQHKEQVTAATEWIDHAEQALGDKASLPDLTHVARNVQELLKQETPTPRPWEYGYQAASACRAQLALDNDHVFTDVHDVARLFGGSRFEVAPDRVEGLRAEANGLDETPKIVVAGLPIPTSRTFAMMRAIGDFVVYGEAGRAPVTDTYSFRQGVGRAFAAEMLAPRAVVLDMDRQGMTTEEIAAVRHISEVVVVHHLNNAQARVAV